MGNYDLSHFTQAHQRDFETALSEIQAGRKTSHWMWYIFPQIRSLGKSSTSVYYAIKNTEEAKTFLDDAYLGNNLIRICNALLELDTNDATSVMGRPDDMKLKSSMTLFEATAGEGSVFSLVLDKYFDGRRDGATLRILGIKK